VVRLAIAATLLVVGCQGELNPTYCAMHLEDPDCTGQGGGEVIDPPIQECTTDADCAGNPNGGACDTTRHLCAQCVPGGNITACTALAQQCGTDQMCHGCITDNNCASGVCLATQVCADEDAVLYATPEGSGDMCTAQAPCSFDGATDQLTAARHIIKLNRGNTGEYADDPITIDENFGVQILAKGVTFRATDDGDGEPAITASGANLEIVGLTVANSASAAIRCTAGVLTLQQVTLTTSTGYGVEATNCNTNLKRGDLSGHPLGAIRITGGMHEIRNNFIHDNGSDSLTTGAVFIENASGRMRFNTVAKNLSENGGGGRVGGIRCSQVGTFALAQNIVVAWGGANDGVAGCTQRNNFESTNFADAGFVSTTDFHLTARSPMDLIRDPNSAIVDVDCTEGDAKIDDFDGHLRPFNNFCDRGADEFSP